tara:strand:+ start:445 stop:1779 length:1335 start_codon:yes stop_codon:yes gene_type:complete
METFSLFKLIAGVSFGALMIFTGLSNKEPVHMIILAVLMTLGLFYGVGQLPYSFLIFIILGMMMHTYVQSASIEDTLFNVLLIITVSIFLGMFGDIDFFKPFKNFKISEGFQMNPSGQHDLVSHSMTAIQCQNACQQKPHCKFAVYSQSVNFGGRGKCFNTKGSDKNQELRGGPDTGYSAWRNKFYEPKPPKVVPFHLRWYSRWPHCNNISCGRGTLKDFKQKCADKNNCDGFSWTKGKNSNNSRGSGCLKLRCKPSQETRKGFGFGSHGYWLKGNEVSKFRDGMFIAIKNNAINRWIAAEGNGRVGNRRHRMTWETFQVLKHPDGKNWMLKSYHGSWLGFLPNHIRNHYGVRPIRRSPYHSVVFSAKGHTPSAGWSWQRVQFVRQGNYWGIYNPYHKRYMNGYSNQKALGVPWLGSHERFKIFEVINGNWGRGSREWNDKEIK